MDRLEAMEAFVTVVEQGGFAAAARHLHQGRSAIHKLVTQLESHLGVTLLERTTRRVLPTPTGQAFYERCRAILASVTEAEWAVSHLQRDPRGKLRLNAPMTFGTLHLAPVLAQFLHQYPEVQLELTLEDRFVDPIVEGFDGVIRISQTVDYPHLISVILGEIPVVICAAPSYLDRQGSPQTPEDLKDHACLHYGTNTPDRRWFFHSDQGERAIVVHGPLCTNNGEVLHQAAIAGLGIAILPEFIVRSSLEQQKLIALMAADAPPPLKLNFLYPQNRLFSTKVQVLQAFLQKHWS